MFYNFVETFINIDLLGTSIAVSYQGCNAQGYCYSPIQKNIEIKARTAILQDFLSGEILYEKEPDRSIYPASMTKIMTSIIAFDFIEFVERLNNIDILERSIQEQGNINNSCFCFNFWSFSFCVCKKFYKNKNRILFK